MAKRSSLDKQFDCTRILHTSRSQTNLLPLFKWNLSRVVCCWLQTYICNFVLHTHEFWPLTWTPRVRGYAVSLLHSYAITIGRLTEVSYRDCLRFCSIWQKKSAKRIWLWSMMNYHELKLDRYEIRQNEWSPVLTRLKDRLIMFFYVPGRVLSERRYHTQLFK